MKEAIQLLEDVIFWEKHTEIYESLEATLRKKYFIKPKVDNKRDSVKLLLDTICSAQMDKIDDLRTLAPEINEKFLITCKEV